MKIDFSELLSRGGTVLAGVERGEAAREKFGMDQLDSAGEDAIVSAPTSLEAISPSFVQGFFSRSLRNLGEQALLSKYTLNLSPELKDDILEGIKRLKMKRRIAGLE